MVGLFASNGSNAILDYNWIEAAFDDDRRLLYLQHHESKRGCARSGNCLRWGGWGPNDFVMTDAAIFTGPEDQDAAAKLFSPPVDGCAIYVFYTSQTAGIARFLRLDDTIAVSVNGAKPHWLNEDTFTRIEIPPGTVEVTVGHSAALLVTKREWMCVTKRVHYVWIKDYFSKPDEIERVDAAIAQEEIAKRRRLLPP